MSRSNPFAAIDPALGYLYQVRLGLLWSLQRLRQDHSFSVSIEVLDDVAFESTGENPSTLLQTKHHASRAASLSDSSSDIWKTLRVWIESTLENSDLSGADLMLVTTGVAPPNSAAHKLKSKNRDVESALRLLDATARTSTNATNAPAYRAYEGLSTTQKRRLLERVLIVDAAPTIADLDEDLRKEVYWAVDRAHQEPFLDRLEGWWLRRVIVQLTSDVSSRISSVEIEAQMADLRDQFRQDSLPIDDDLLDFTLDDVTASAHQQHRFVRQLEVIEAGKRRIANAIRDYYRAYEQRSRWVREDLIVSLDLRRYEKRLIEEWEVIFDAVCDEVGSSATEDAKLKAARSVLQWAERASIPIRPGVAEPFLCRGSLHIISDDGRIGWHPEFRGLLASVLAPSRRAE